MCLSRRQALGGAGAGSAEHCVAAAARKPPRQTLRRYLLADADTKEGVLIDPVDTLVDRDVSIAKEMGVNIIYGLNT